MLDAGLRQELLTLQKQPQTRDACEALAAKMAAAAETTEELIALMNDDELGFYVWHAASEVLAVRGPAEARFVLERQRASAKGRRLAVAQFSSAALYELFVALRPRAKDTEARSLWFAIVERRGGVRDPRWLALAHPADLSDIAMLVAIGRDLGHPARDEAVAKLVTAMEGAKDFVTRGRYVDALGDIGSPAAVPALLRELAREKYASLVILALSRCGGLELVPTLEERAAADPSDAGLCAQAIERLRARAAREARIDADPVLAELTRQVRAGDLEAAMVLEDALRERGLDQVP